MCRTPGTMLSGQKGVTLLPALPLTDSHAITATSEQLTLVLPVHSHCRSTHTRLKETSIYTLEFDLHLFTEYATSLLKADGDQLRLAKKKNSIFDIKYFRGTEKPNQN